MSDSPRMSRREMREKGLLGPVSRDSESMLDTQTMRALNRPSRKELREQRRREEELAAQAEALVVPVSSDLAGEPAEDDNFRTEGVGEPHVVEQTHEGEEAEHGEADAGEGESHGDVPQRASVFDRFDNDDDAAHDTDRDEEEHHGDEQGDEPAEEHTDEHGEEPAAEAEAEVVAEAEEAVEEVEPKLEAEAEELAEEEPAAEEPAEEAPAAQEPAAEEPAAEEKPADEKPAVDEEPVDNSAATAAMPRVSRYATESLEGEEERKRTHPLVWLIIILVGVTVGLIIGVVIAYFGKGESSAMLDVVTPLLV